MILSGRDCAATTGRMRELGADCIFQNIRNKSEFILSFMAENGLSKSDVCYIGDDTTIFLRWSLRGMLDVLQTAAMM